MSRGRQSAQDQTGSVLEALSEAIDAFIYAKDREGRFIFVNQKLATYSGLSIEEMLGRQDSDFLPPEPAARIRQNDLEVMEGGLSLQREERGIDEPGVFLSVKSPLRDATGTIIGIVGVTTNITDRKRAQQAVAESENRLKQMLDQVLAFVALLDCEGNLVHVNREPLNRAEITLEQVVGQPFAETPWWSYDAQVQAQLREAIVRARVGELVRYDEVVRMADNTRLPIDFQLAPMYNDDGTLSGLIASAVDIQQRRLAEEERDLVMFELAHRIKNTLSVVQSLAHSTLGGIADDAGKVRAFEQRLQALAATHDQLVRRQWEATDLAQLAKGIVFNAGGTEARVAMSGPSVEVAPEKAVTVALAFHELTTNAIKYGALSQPSGSIAINWSVDGDRVNVDWIERGVLLRETSSPKKGFGSRMIEQALSRHCDGTIKMHFGADGLRCTMLGLHVGPHENNRRSPESQSNGPYPDQ